MFLSWRTVFHLGECFLGFSSCFIAFRAHYFIASVDLDMLGIKFIYPLILALVHIFYHVRFVLIMVKTSDLYT